jgi:hypothetical protein
MTIKIDGTQGFVFPDGTVQKTVASGVGIGTAQQWYELTTRVVGTWYQNNTSKAIMVSINRYGGDGAWNILYVQDGAGNIGIAARTSIGNYGGASSMLTAIVPPLHYYKLDGTTTYNRWRELR